MLTLLWTFFLGNAFPVSTAVNEQLYPSVVFAGGQSYVFWVDLRHYPPDRSIYAARVTTDGTVLDPGGCEILRGRCEWADAAFDGGNFMVALQDSC